MAYTPNLLLLSLQALLSRGLDNKEIAQALRDFPFAEFNDAMVLILEDENRADLTPEEVEANRALRQRIRRIRDAVIHLNSPSGLK